jgi:hypothetical protein
MFSFQNGLSASQICFFDDPLSMISGDPALWQVQSKDPSAIFATSARYFPSYEFATNAGKTGNGRKLAFSAINHRDDKVVIGTRRTDFFTLWRLNEACPELHAEMVKQVVEYGMTHHPVGICAHMIVLVKTSDSGPLSMVMKVSPQDAGFHAGTVGGGEEQADPGDKHPFDTPRRCLSEEFGLTVSNDDIVMLGAGMEHVGNYYALAFAATVTMTEAELRAAWELAPDKGESTELFLVPVTALDEWFSPDGVAPSVWKKYVTGKQIADDAVLRLHPMMPWRGSLLKTYLETLGQPTW